MSHTDNSSNVPHEVVLVNSSQQVLHVNMTNVSCLTSTNYLMWSRQVHALLDGYELAGYLDGSVIQHLPLSLSVMLSLPIPSLPSGSARINSFTVHFSEQYHSPSNHFSLVPLPQVRYGPLLSQPMPNPAEVTSNSSNSSLSNGQKVQNQSMNTIRV